MRSRRSVLRLLRSDRETLTTWSGRGPQQLYRAGRCPGLSSWERHTDDHTSRIPARSRVTNLMNSLQRHEACSHVNQDKDHNRPSHPSAPRVPENRLWGLEPRAGVGVRRLNGLNRRTVRDAAFPVTAAVLANDSGVCHLPRAIGTQLHKRSLNEVMRGSNSGLLLPCDCCRRRPAVHEDRQRPGVFCGPCNRRQR